MNRLEGTVVFGCIAALLWLATSVFAVGSDQCPTRIHAPPQGTATVQCSGTCTHLGNPGVCTATGYRTNVDEIQEWELRQDDKWYKVVAYAPGTCQIDHCACKITTLEGTYYMYSACCHLVMIKKGIEWAIGTRGQCDGCGEGDCVPAGGRVDYWAVCLDD